MILKKIIATIFCLLTISLKGIAAHEIPNISEVENVCTKFYWKGEVDDCFATNLKSIEKIRDQKIQSTKLTETTKGNIKKYWRGFSKRGCELAVPYLDEIETKDLEFDLNFITCLYELNYRFLENLTHLKKSQNQLSKELVYSQKLQIKIAILKKYLNLVAHYSQSESKEKQFDEVLSSFNELENTICAHNEKTGECLDSYLTMLESYVDIILDHYISLVFVEFQVPDIIGSPYENALILLDESNCKANSGAVDFQNCVEDSNSKIKEVLDKNLTEFIATHNKDEQKVVETIIEKNNLFGNEICLLLAEIYNGHNQKDTLGATCHYLMSYHSKIILDEFSDKSHSQNPGYLKRLNSLRDKLSYETSLIELNLKALSINERDNFSNLDAKMHRILDSISETREYVCDPNSSNCKLLIEGVIKNWMDYLFIATTYKAFHNLGLEELINP